MKKFLQELKRRNVLKASLSYVAISWALLQVGALVLPLLGMSTSILRIFLIILACGFPVWVVFAYFYELTPGGFKPTAEVAEEKSIHRNTSKKLNGYIMAGLSLAVIFLVADRFLDFEVSLEEPETTKSIAVLPFENRGEAEDEYFASGITEDILTQISGIGDLRVLSRFTLKDYESEGKSPRKIGEELGVSNLLVGSIRKRGEQLRISCQLIQTGDESEAWAKTFDRKWDNVFKIQSEIALEIAANLKTTLTSQEERLIKTTTTQNIAAYNLYLRGRGIYDLYTQENNERAITLFKDALKLDPEYGLAMAGLADAYGQAVIRYGNRPYEYLDSCLLIAEKATMLHAGLPEAWKALGLAYSYKGNNQKAEENYKKALSLNPNHAESINNLGVQYGRTGRIPEAIKFYKKSAQLQPINATPFGNLAAEYWELDLMETAGKFLNHAIELDNDESVKMFREFANEYFISNDKEEALNQLIKMADLNQTNPQRLADAADNMVIWYSPETAKEYLVQLTKLPDYDTRTQMYAPLSISYLLLKENKRDSAKALLDRQIDFLNEEIAKGNKEYLHALMVAYAVKGDVENAIETLNELLAVGNVYYRTLQYDERLSSIHNDPEYKRIFAELKSQRAEMRREVIREDASTQLEGLSL